MSRILAYTSPARGHLFPLTPILDELQARGHSVCVRTLASEVPRMRARGFEAAPIDPAIERIELRDWQAGGARKALAASVGTFVARAEYDAADLRAAIAEHAPDVVLVDVNTWGASAAAQEWGGPWAVFCPYPLPLSSPQVPPFGPGLPPAAGPLGRARDRVLRPLLHGALEKQMLPGLNEIRAGIGLRRLSSIDEQFLLPPLLLYLTAEPFEYHRDDWPASVVMVGACPWEPDIQAPAWLDDIDDPIVLVTTSSEFQDDGHIVEAALEALADEPVHVVATMPAEQASLIAAPANARVERFVPHGPVLARAVCAITHGGMGATQKALSFGVPVCAVPHGRDQLEVARRVEVAGAGTRLPKRQLRPDRLRAKVRAAMSMRAGAQAVREGYERAGGAPAAASAIERRLLADAAAGRQVT